MAKPSGSPDVIKFSPEMPNQQPGDRVPGQGAQRDNRRVRPSRPEDRPEIVALMKDAGLTPDLDPGHLHWKYWQERLDWPGTRSFVFTDGEHILAHGAVMPGTLRWGTTQARMIHMIDWAARRDAVGAGILLMKHIGTMTDFLIGVGGSEQTLRIMPLMGYRHCGTVTGYVRTLSSWRLLSHSGGALWKRAPRMARSVLWALSAPRALTDGWRARRIAIDEVAQVADVLAASGLDRALPGRTPELIRHALGCPIVPVELHALERAGRIGGYFLLSYTPGQARLIDLRMASQEPADWRALLHSAVREAGSRGGLAEIVAWSSDPHLSQVFESCGFHARLTLPIYLRSSGETLPPQETLQVQMLDNDAFYLDGSRKLLWV